jgi:hypothetical protein
VTIAYARKTGSPAFITFVLAAVDGAKSISDAIPVQDV